MGPLYGRVLRPLTLGASVATTPILLPKTRCVFFKHPNHGFLAQVDKNGRFMAKKYAQKRNDGYFDLRVILAHSLAKYQFLTWKLHQMF